MADALAQLQLAGAGGVLTLMTVEELALCGPLSLGQLVQARGMSWFHLPIADDEAPDAPFIHGQVKSMKVLMEIVSKCKQQHNSDQVVMNGGYMSLNSE
jgi:hypothetical protein